MESSESLSQDELRILHNLQELERYSALRDFSNIEVNDIAKIVIETIEWIAESIESSDVELPMQIMDLLEYLDNVES